MFELASCGLFGFFRVKELGPESNAKRRAAPADGSDDDGPPEDGVSRLGDARNVNNTDLALLCNHSVRSM